MKYLVILTLLFKTTFLGCQCIPTGVPPVVIVDPINISIDFTDFGDALNSRQRGRFQVFIESQKIGGGPSDVGEHIPLIIKDEFGATLAQVDLIVGQTNTSGFINDVGGLYASNFVPFMTSSILDPILLDAGTYNFFFDKSDWAISNSRYYTDGSMIGSDWISLATDLEFNIGAINADMEKVVDLFQGYIGRNFTGAGGSEHYTFVNQRQYLSTLTPGNEPDIFNLTSLTVTQDGVPIIIGDVFDEVQCDVPSRVHDVCFYRPSISVPNISQTVIGYTMDATFSNGMVSSNFGRNGLSPMHITGNNESSTIVSSTFQYQVQIRSTASLSFPWVSFSHFFVTPTFGVDMIFDGVTTNYALPNTIGLARYTNEHIETVSSLGTRFDGSHILVHPTLLTIEGRADFQYELNYVY